MDGNPIADAATKDPVVLMKFRLDIELFIDVGMVLNVQHNFSFYKCN